MFEIFTFFNSKKKKAEEFQNLIAEINKAQEELTSLTNDELRNQTEELRKAIKEELKDLDRAVLECEQKINSNNDILIITNLYDEIDKKEKERYDKCEDAMKKNLAKAFAIVKETCFRFSNADAVVVNANEFDEDLSTKREYVHVENGNAIYSTQWFAGGKEIKWKMVPFNSQLLTGIILQEGEIAEMLNGEGKTLAAVFPLFLSAVAKRKVHVCTDNPFLAERDCCWMRPILEFHGISVTNITENEPNTDERRDAYRADIIYGKADEFGFDYLRDNMIYSGEEQIQTTLDIAVVDEIDSVLIDNARTPLIISGPQNKNDFVLEQYFLLNPAVQLIIEKQQEFISELFDAALHFWKNNETEQACESLFLVKSGDPKNIQLHNLITTNTNIFKQLNKFENYIRTQGLNEETESPLYFVIKSDEIELTEKGKKFIETNLSEPDFWITPDINSESKLIEKENLNVIEQIEKKNSLFEKFKLIEERHNIIMQLLKAYVLFKRDREYIVKNEEVLIVDDITGRILPGRRYSNGLHQAIEAKENVRVQSFTQSYATISLMAYFRKYKKLCGMTATAVTDEREYKTVYNKKVFKVPPFKPCIRTDLSNLVFKTKREKLSALIDEVIELTKKSRPVLIGTTTVEDSELISHRLCLKNISHNLLNAKEAEREALIIANAGVLGSVTIAARMAGRGTDIKLSEESIEAGGLAVLGFERHDSRRLDQQLQGRAGRQGDPGTSQFFVSLEDELMIMFGSERIAKVMEFAGYREGEVIQHSMIDKSIERAQKKVEENNLGIRSRLYEYDNSLHLAREAIYQKRNHALSGHRLKLDIINMFDHVSSMIVNMTNKKTYDEFVIQVLDTFNYKTEITAAQFKELSKNDLTDKLYFEAYNHYLILTKNIITDSYAVILNIRNTQSETIVNVSIPVSGKTNVCYVIVSIEKALNSFGEEVIRKIEEAMIINTIDVYWKNFLIRYDEIKSDISLLTSIEKGDPLVLFKKDISNYYVELLEEIHFEIIKNLCFASLPTAN
jgi:preprotein translocase subunit SecA